MRFLIAVGWMGLLLGSAHTAMAASPAISRGELLLPIGFDECIARARAAFTAEGYGIVRNDDTSYVFAGRDIHSAYITCSPAPNDKMWVNVFVASLTHEGKIPGAERVKLMDRLARDLTPQSFAGTWSVTKDWRTMTLEQKGDQVTGRYFTPAGVITGQVYGDTLVFKFKDDSGGQKGRAYLRLTSDRTAEGRWCPKDCDPKAPSALPFDGKRP